MAGLESCDDAPVGLDDELRPPDRAALDEGPTEDVYTYTLTSSSNGSSPQVALPWFQYGTLLQIRASGFVTQTNLLTGTQTEIGPWGLYGGTNGCAVRTGLSYYSHGVISLSCNGLSSVETVERVLTVYGSGSANIGMGNQAGCPEECNYSYSGSRDITVTFPGQS